MNKRGGVLILSLLMMLIMIMLSTALFLKTINENKLTTRYVGAVEAFWLAEAGIAMSKGNLPDNTSGCMKSNYCYAATTEALGNWYYQIDSTGTVTLSSGATIEKSLRAIVRVDPPDSSKFQYAIETTGDLVIKGQAYTITPEDSFNEQAVLNFSDLFANSKESVKNMATHLYDESTFGEPVDGITWVEVSPGVTLTTAGNLQGSGILVIEGDVHMSGTENFEGIIYVIGELSITGNVAISGSVLAESGAGIDTTIKGSVDLAYDPDLISAALANLGFSSSETVSWQDIE
ncbi:MAG: hypothetical protein K9L86_04535 [Candidatus Omnitrophica bacterium]|nr:hypothetical protein [Candidatus Omnitrophota bacterium]